MKKLLVVALSAMLVLAYASVSMAAIAVTGEANFTYDVTNSTQSSDCKLVFDAAVNDTVSVNAAIKGTSAGSVGTVTNVTPVDPLVSVDATTPYGVVLDTFSATIQSSDALSVKLGYFGTGFGGSTDILDKAIADVKGPANALISYNVSDAIAVKFDLLYGDPIAYAVILAYTSDAISADLGIVDGGQALNFAYTMGAIKAYLNYEKLEAGAQDEIVGVVYTGDALSARLEYDAETQTSGVKLGYTLSNGIALALKNVAETSTITATVKF
jgi:hypothetical protein